MIDNINEISHLVDGYITVNGAYCFEKEEIISFHPIPEANVRKILSLADEMNFACMVVSKNDLVILIVNGNMGMLTFASNFKRHHFGNGSWLCRQQDLCSLEFYRTAIFDNIGCGSEEQNQKFVLLFSYLALSLSLKNIEIWKYPNFADC